MKFISRLACFGCLCCLPLANAFGDGLSARTKTLLIGPSDTKVTFKDKESASGSNVPVDNAEAEFTGLSGMMESINVVTPTNAANYHGISLNSANSTKYVGKSLTLVNERGALDDSAWLVSAVKSGAALNSHGVAVNLAGASGFTLSLDNTVVAASTGTVTPKNYKFMSGVVSDKIDSNNEVIAVGVGMDSAASALKDFTFKGNGAKVQIESNGMITKGSILDDVASAFGVDSVAIGFGGVATGAAIDNVQISGIGNDSKLFSAATTDISTASSSSKTITGTHTTRSSVIGVTYLADGGSLNNWKLSESGSNVQLASCAISRVSADNATGASMPDAYATVVGAAHANNATAVLSNFDLGTFKSGTALSAFASTTTDNTGNAGNAYAAVIGNASGGVFNGLTVEFKGSASIAALGLATKATSVSVPENVHLAAIGGHNNSDFKLYFSNDSSGVTDPKLAAANVVIAALPLSSVTESEEITGFTLGAGGETHKAIAVGNNMALNFGYSRDGSQSISPGEVYIYGEISKASGIASDGNTGGSIMRIGGNYSVVAYKTIKDFKTIDLENGLLTLETGGDTILTTSGDKDDFRGIGIYNGVGISAISDVTNITAATYKVDGKLVLSDGEKIVFHVNPGEAIAASPIFRKVSGGLAILERSDGALTEDVLSFSNGAKLSVVSSGENKLVYPGMVFNIITGSFKNSSNTALSSNAKDKINNVAKYNGNALLSDAATPVGLTNTITLYPATDASKSLLELGDNLGSLSLYGMYDSSVESGKGGASFGFVLGAFGDEAKTVPDAAKKAVVSEGESRTAASALSAVQGIVDGRDVKGDSDDPFVQVFGAWDHQKGILNGKTFGLLGGLDFVKEMKNGALLRYGALASFGQTNVKHKSSMIDNSKKNKQNMFFCGAFGTYESFDAQNLKMDISAMVGVGYFKNKLNRTNSEGIDFNARHGDSDLYASVSFVKNLARYNGIQVGPYVGISLNRVHQRAYSEKFDSGIAGAQDRAMSVNKADFTYLDTTIGVNAEREIRHISNPEKRCKIYSKIGWSCQAVRSRSGGNTTLGSFNPFSPVFSDNARNSAAITLGLRNRFSKHVEVYCELFGKFGKKKSHISLGLGAGYTF
jgi:hypothetical protein